MSHLHPGATNVASLFRPGNRYSRIEQTGNLIRGILVSELELDTATRVDQQKEPKTEYTTQEMQPYANFLVEYRPQEPKCAYIILTKSGKNYGRFSLCENEDKIVRPNDLKYEPPPDLNPGMNVVYDWDEQGAGVESPPVRSRASSDMGGRRRRRTRRRKGSKSTFGSRKRTL